jgi:Ca-activated chloride channel family protein
VGYANRKLAARDFNDDGIDAGEVGAGHAVTAFYEVVPTEISSQAGVDSLRYQQPRLEPTAAARSGELLTVKLRYKLPDETESRLLSRTAVDRGSEGESSNPDFRFASAVALFGELLMESPHVADHDFADVLALLEGAVQDDPSGQRTEFFDLVLRAMEL